MRGLVRLSEAKRLAKALGLDEEGVVRVSMVHYNTIEEVDRLLAVLEERLPGEKRWVGSC